MIVIINLVQLKTFAFVVLYVLMHKVTLYLLAIVIIKKVFLFLFWPPAKILIVCSSVFNQNTTYLYLTNQFRCSSISYMYLVFFPPTFCHRLAGDLFDFFLLLLQAKDLRFFSRFSCLIKRFVNNLLLRLLRKTNLLLCLFF